MVKKEVKLITETRETETFVFTDKNKAEIVKALPKILGYAIKEGYESISELFDSIGADNEIIFLLGNYVDFIGEEIEFIDTYTHESNSHVSYVGFQIINFITNYEKNNFIKPDLTELMEDDEALSNFFENKCINERLTEFLKDKPELKKELIKLCL